MRQQFQWCWRCGRSASDKPDWWHGPWQIDRSHMVNKPRRCDRRAVIMLCRLCHRIQHGDVFKQLPAEDREPLSLSQQLLIKKTIDPLWYDRKWLQKHHVGKLPRASA